ncbi:MAG: DUF2062 domain-containing protein [Spirulinaceae cyanobacterium RM2_2_10]|nr:DUF2062 domain-containing protein [Spirulinaceae cyanobacterium SM2_1_0]NJO20914.1 DUF2062 domain-containing protein [Spirulinaceae cyanobacterium RM2_2_10]
MPPKAPESTAAPRRPRTTGSRRLRYYYYRFLRLQGSPQAIARGLAAGVFAGCFPIFGFQTLVGIAIAIPARGNKIAAAAGTWVSNPFTYVPIYFFNLRLGERLLGRPVDLTGLDGQAADFGTQLLNLGSDVVLTLFLGCAVSGLVLATLGYALGLWAIQRFQHSRRQRRRERKQAAMVNG